MYNKYRYKDIEGGRLQQKDANKLNRQGENQINHRTRLPGAGHTYRKNAASCPHWPGKTLALGFSRETEPTGGTHLCVWSAKWKLRRAYVPVRVQWQKMTDVPAQQPVSSSLFPRLLDKASPIWGEASALHSPPIQCSLHPETPHRHAQFMPDQTSGLPWPSQGDINPPTPVPSVEMWVVGTEGTIWFSLEKSNTKQCVWTQSYEYMYVCRCKDGRPCWPSGG